MIWHLHHVWPRHAIGPTPKNNLLRCNVAMHTFMHKLEYEKWGRWEDKLAYRLLSGEANLGEKKETFRIEAGRKSGQNLVGRSERSRRINAAMTWEQKSARGKKGINQPPTMCTKCGKTGQRAAMGRWHFENCRVVS